jgi:hypothetical protein
MQKVYQKQTFENDNLEIQTLYKKELIEKLQIRLH